MIEPIIWIAPEFKKQHKNKSWFAAIVIIFASLIFVALVLESITGAIVFGFSAILLIIYGKKEPKKIKINISSQGVAIGEEFYRFDNIKSFWLIYEPPLKKELILTLSKTFTPHIHIQIGNKDPNKIRKLLLKFLPEEPKEESLIDIIAEKIGF